MRQVFNLDFERNWTEILNKAFECRGTYLDLAERVGFEPTVTHNATPDFESGTFDHSDTSP
jgi:hypothetical protein